MSETNSVSRVVMHFFSTKIENGVHVSKHPYAEMETKLIQLFPGREKLLSAAIDGLKEMVDAHVRVLNTFPEQAPSQVLKNMHLVYMNQIGEYVTSLRRFVDIIAMIDSESVQTHGPELQPLAATFRPRVNQVIDSLDATIDELSQGVPLIK
jgi:hypothetical protein